jgi:hypothetical protein
MVKQIISLPPKLVYCSSQAESSQICPHTSTTQNSSTPTRNIILIQRRLKNRALGYNISPNSGTEAASKEEMFNTLLSTITEQTKAISIVTPTAHLLLCNQSIPEHKPKNKCMFRYGHGEPNHFHQLTIGKLTLNLPQVSTQVYFPFLESQTGSSVYPKATSCSLL